MRGRKPKPTHLKLLAGNPGGRPLNDAEPRPEGDLVAPPAWLTEAQKLGWRHAIEHAPRGLLKRLDGSLLAAWCVAEDTHRIASGKVSEFGMVVKTPAGVLIQSPYMAIVNRQVVIMARLAEQLGFSPAARPRIRVEQPPKGENPFAEFREIP